MSDELTRLLGSVRSDADGVMLAEPAALRRVGTRRTRMRRGLVVALATIVLVTGSVAVNRVTTRGAPIVNRPPAPSVSSEPAPSESPEPGRPSGTYADDVCSTDLAACRAPTRWWYEEKLPAPCSSTNHPSDAQMIARRARTVTPEFNRWALRYSQTFVRYSGDGAGRFVGEVESALSRCSSVRRRVGSEPQSEWVTLRYRKVSSGAFSADVSSLLLSRTYTFAGREVELLVVVARVGDVVVVVSDMGMLQGPLTPTTEPMAREKFDAAVESSVREARAWT